MALQLHRLHRPGAAWGKMHPLCTLEWPEEKATQREPESKSKRDDRTKSSVMAGVNSPPPSQSFRLSWFGANNRSTSQQLLMIEKRASRPCEWKQVFVIAISASKELDLIYNIFFEHWALGSRQSNSLSRRDGQKSTTVTIFHLADRSFQWRGGVCSTVTKRRLYNMACRKEACLRSITFQTEEVDLRQSRRFNYCD